MDSSGRTYSRMFLVYRFGEVEQECSYESMRRLYREEVKYAGKSSSSLLI